MRTNYRLCMIPVDIKTLKNDWVVYTQKTTHAQMLHLDARGQNDYEYEGRTTKFANFGFTRLGRIFSK